ncbi:MAG: ArdC-like ssDNA-binding domain-containing protein [Burkholderiales bacterium]
MLKHLYSRVTARIVEDLEKGVRPWMKPWSAPTSRPHSSAFRHNGTPYRGINILLLWSDATDKGFSSVALSFG